MDFTHIRREVSEGGICTLTVDKPGSSANIFDQRTFLEMDGHLDFIESSAVRGVIFISAKDRIFIAGADLIGFTQGGITPETLGGLIEQGQRAFQRIARLRIPTVAAIHGVCLGGGLELALACDWRVASNASQTKLGLPEVLLGILPAWGGSTRLPRLVGLPAALGAILTGKQYAARQALKLGLVDEIAYREGLPHAAEKRIISGKRPRLRTFLSNKPLISNLIAAAARKRTLAKTRGNYPAPIKALEIATKGLHCPIEESMRNEKAAFIDLAATEASRNLLRVFLLRERAKKLQLPAGPVATAVHDRPDALDNLSDSGRPDKPRPVRRAAVIGAGIMGAGIAQWLAARGVRVLLKDIGPEPLARGMQSISKILGEAARRHVFTRAEAAAAGDRIVPISTDVPMRDLDLIIEAAVERLDLKQEIFAKLEDVTGPETVLATNTSALSIDAISRNLRSPERVVGIHFFNPVHRMELVEIVRGTRSSTAAVETALAFVKAIGKLPVIVKDSPGFLVNRILLPYMAEAVRLFQMGHPARRIDDIMLDFGMPMGPLRLADEVGLDVARHVAKDLEQRLPHAVPMNDILEHMTARGWLGKKSGVGFYSYQGRGGGAGETVHANQEAASFQGTVPQPISAEMMQDRMVLVMVNEAARAIEEGIVGAPEDVDFGMIMGTGWAPFRGGPLRYADRRGLPAAARRMEELSRESGEYFAPCALIQDMAARKAAFYSKP